MSHPAKILYIDDDSSNRLLAKKILQKAGFEYYEAENGLSGIELACQLKPDLILMDISLPDLDGYAATIRIKSMPGLGSTPIVALTGHSMEGDRERALSAGCDGYIAKPINIHTLATDLSSYLQGKKETVAHGSREAYLREYNVQLVTRLEEKIRELSSINLDLEKRVAEKAEELQETQAQLLQSEKMASIGQLSAGVAHEINNPVGFVSSNLDSMSHDITSLLELIRLYERLEIHIPKSLSQLNELQQHKEKIDLNFLQEDLPALINESRDGLQRVRQIVQDLKDFSHVGASSWERVDIHHCLDSTLNIVYNDLKYKAAIQRDYADLPMIECVPGKINQVFMNLLVNAGHAIEEKGNIRIKTGHAGEKIWIEISDDGSGMDEKTLKNIFDPFFTTKPVGQGTGLGLSLSYGIINDHKGKIELESELGHGTTFRIWLPIDQEKP